MPKIYHKFLPLVFEYDKTSYDSSIVNIKNAFFSLNQTFFGGFKIYKRNGIKTIRGFNFAIDAIAFYDRLGEYIVISGGSVFILDDNFSIKKSYELGLPIGIKYNIVITNYGAVIAYGGRLLYYDGNLRKITGEAFSKVSSVAYIDGRLIFNDLRSGYTQFVRVSEVIDMNGVSYDDIWFEETTKGDDIVTLAVSGRLLYVFSRNSITVWSHSGLGVFERIEPLTMDVGIVDERSIAVYGSKIAFVSSDNRIFLLEGGNVTNISQPFLDRISELDLLKYANLFFIALPENLYLVVSLPNANKSYYYSFITKSWGELTSDLKDNMFVGKCACIANGKTVIGCYNGALGIIDRHTFTDIGNVYEFAVETGNITHGTFINKISRKAVYAFYIGEIPDKTNNIGVTISYNNDNRGYINTEKVFIFEPLENTLRRVVIAPNGIYSTRQVRIANSNDCYIELHGFEEYLEVLG